MAVTGLGRYMYLDAGERAIIELALEMAIHADNLAATLQGRDPDLTAEYREIVLQLRDRFRA